MVNVAIVGASGYTGGELLRILLHHPEVEVTVATSREYKGKPVHYVHFNLRGLYKGLIFTDVDIDLISKKSDVVFLSVPHGVSLRYVPKFLEVGLRVIDLSADFRLKNPEDYVKWYGFEHPYPDLLSNAVYGLPEIHRDELRGARLIASPGCNATAALLSLIPLVKFNVIDLHRIIIDVKVGSSEGGSKPSLSSHHSEREGSIRPYSVEGHRHAAEVEQELRYISSKKEVEVSLTPHAVSSIRGALATSYSWALKNISEVDLVGIFAEVYAKEPFIRIVHKLPPGHPNPKYVIGSNYADVGFGIEARLSLIKSFAAIDNLVKGAAGQAVQAFNIALGFKETLGIELAPIKPV